MWQHTYFCQFYVRLLVFVHLCRVFIHINYSGNLRASGKEGGSENMTSHTSNKPILILTNNNNNNKHRADSVQNSCTTDIALTREVPQSEL
jgi:hypothetical protein